MAKTKISEYDSTASGNTDIDGINIAESCPPSGINNAIREVMAHLKDFQSGVSGDKLPIASGGTNAGTASDARTNLGLGSIAILNSIATANIDADAITNAKIADDSIDSEHIVDGAIDTVHIGDDQVTTAKLADNSVNATKLNVSGNGTSGQVLVSDGDGSFSWTSADTTGSLGANGYTTFSNGLMIQWGTFENTIDTPQTVSFPTSFTTACYCVLTDVPLVSGETTFTTTTFTVDRDNAIDGTLTRFFIAIGQ